MVTASHNPPQDNGYKVYLGDGSQIVPPADAEIASEHRRGGVREPTCPAAPTRGRWARTSSTATSTTSPSWPLDGPRDLSIVYTPLHGVGGTAVDAGARDRRLRGAAGREPAGAPRPGLPDRRLPQPGGGRRDGPRDGPRRRARRGPRGRQRPRRRPLRGRSAHSARLADAARRRGRRPARAPPAASAAGPGRSRPRSSPRHCWARWPGLRAAVRRDAHRLQVDRPGRGARLRLRGGARLLLRPRPREGQGRRLRAAAALRAGRRVQGRRPVRWWTCSTTWRSSTGCMRPTSCRSASTSST